MPARFGILAAVALAVMALDQWTKWLTLAHIPEHRPISVIPGLFALVNVRNRGAAFGFLNRSDIEWQFWLFLGATVVAVAAIVALIRSMRAHDGRLVFGSWHWPAFNVADMAICLGALLACLSLWRPLPGEERPQKERKQ